MASLPPEYDQTYADFNYQGPFDPNLRDSENIQFLVALSALALAGVGAFFSEASLLAGTAPGVVDVIPAGTVVSAEATGTVQMTVQEEIAFFCEGNGTLSNTEARAALEAITESGALDSVRAQMLLEGMMATAAEDAAAPSLLKIFTLDSLMALYNYDVSHDGPRYGYFGGYLGNYVPGGLSTPPGFPDFPGHGYPIWDPYASPGHFFCVRYLNVDYCHWEY